MFRLGKSSLLNGLDMDCEIEELKLMAANFFS
jgi:hypothetical protein